MSVYAKAAIVVGILFGIHFGIAQFVDANFNKIAKQTAYTHKSKKQENHKKSRYSFTPQVTFIPFGTF